MRVFIHNLGCDKNRVDGEKLLARLLRAGFQRARSPGKADLIIVNTCGFIREAKEESIGAVMAHARKSRVAVVGCLSERYPSELKKTLSEADLIEGLAFKRSTADSILEKYGRTARTAGPGEMRILSDLPHSAPLKIAEGCGNHCSYCAIPLIRGRFEARSENDILSEARFLRAKGVRELILVAQDITAYGHRKGLPGLIRKMCRLPSPFDWIRLMYCHPSGVSDELMEVIAEEPLVVKYIDMPLQHVSDRMLKRMNRPYSGKDAARLVEKLRARVPGLCIRTTFLVGFPGETETDFEELYGFAKSMEFDRMGAFAYSPEEGTPAFRFKGRVRPAAALDRLERLMELQGGIMLRKNREKVGETLAVLIDSEEKGVFHGRTAQDAPGVDCGVRVAGGSFKTGRFYDLTIKRAGVFDLTA